MLSYALDVGKWHESYFNYQEEDSLLEAVIPGFVHFIEKAFQRGILQGYRTEETALMTVRGRIRFDEQIRKHFGNVLPVEVRYDEFTEDIEENRLIKAALVKLSRIQIRSVKARLLLRHFEAVLAPVSLINYDPHRLPELSFNRLNQHYKPAVELAKFIIKSMSFEFKAGFVQAPTFLVDMNEIFENFIVVALREALGITHKELQQGKRAGTKKFQLDTKHKIQLAPDLVWWAEDRYAFVGDVKYKDLHSYEFLHSDIYQLLAYTIATGLAGGLLIYAGGEKEKIEHEIINLGKKLQIVTLNLDVSPDNILEQLTNVASTIQNLRKNIS